MNAIETLEYNDRTVEIVVDEDPQDPINDCDGNAIFVCFHKRYKLGTKDNGYKSSDFSSWNELEDKIIKDHKGAIILPIYMLDHSGISISTSHEYPYNDQWDAGTVGFIFCTPKMIKEWYAIKKITKSIKERATQDLIAQVKNYSAYLEGRCYGYIIKDKSGVELDSCFGFIGDIEYVKNEAKSVIDNMKPTKPQENSNQMALSL